MGGERKGKDEGKEGQRGGDGVEVHRTQSAETVLLLLAGWLADTAATASAALIELAHQSS